MKIEVLTGKEFQNVVENIGINAKRLYNCPVDHPYYEIWEIEKSDLRMIEEVCMSGEVLFCYSKGANRGTPYEPLTINGQFVIGWTAMNNKDNFNCLTDYFKDGLGVTDNYEVCACATTMAKTNGWSLSQLWRKLEG